MRELRTYAGPLALSVCLGLIAGCQTMSGPGLTESIVTAQLSPESAAAIAGDMVASLSEQIGPGSTTIVLRGHDPIFGPALEASLRGQGYAVVTDQATDGIAVAALAYSVDPFEGGVLVRLSTARVELTRMYTANASDAAPASPLSVMQRMSAGTA
ncbi:conjugal transfer protein TrbH [Jiella pacifica]|uniref:Conjugal transfer protein TrbH n=1 Tax=Jiella pacifica TaxID=2696469 RepID=A0A6N9T8L5_9HYPH|nr:conjugal transfer protein TrbH [Jiella pacifica]NDW07640.1 conjugal transfer protein TrbH [Jiella pacifica]